MGAWEDANCFVNGTRNGRGMMGVSMIADERAL
jgi:hypothetical protein